MQQQQQQPQAQQQGRLSLSHGVPPARISEELLVPVSREASGVRARPSIG
jgi:hypothetical protein